MNFIILVPFLGSLSLYSYFGELGTLFGKSDNGSGNFLFRTKAPIPCKKCSSVLFCSAECRQASYFHTIECPILDLLTGSGMSINCFLSLRLLTQYPLSTFLALKDQLTEEDPKVCMYFSERTDKCVCLLY